MRTKVLIFSEHDYRTARRANFHPIADALIGFGYDVTFISVRFSLLSLISGDSRNSIPANKPTIHNGVECYLWRTLVHPFNPNNLPVSPVLTIPLYWIYSRLHNDFIDNAIRSSSIIIVESGLGAILLPRARALNRTAKLIYYASDNLDMIGAHPFVQRNLEQCSNILDHVCLASKRMAPKFHWIADRIYLVPHGINPADFAGDFDSPYSEGLNGVSVGSGLFDPEFFLHAASEFPGVSFHVIGSGAKLNAAKNLQIYDEMPFTQTLRFIKNATFGIAPYRFKSSADYVSDTSMKLMQYDYVGIPAVCPKFVVGDSPNRFGYFPGDFHSIKAAIEAAIAARQRVRPHGQFLTWEEVARRILDPQLFSDTRLATRQQL
jgi:2-beta-glucuronyltransferase